MVSNYDHYFYDRGKRFDLWKMIESHEEWIRSNHAHGERLDLSNKTLVNVTFPRDCNLNEAILEATEFNGVTFNGVNFEKCNMCSVEFRHCTITNSDFTSADMTCSLFNDAIVSECIFKCANLTKSRLVAVVFWKVNFRYACLKDAYLDCHHMIYARFDDGTKDVPTNIPMACPSEGSFVGWKVARDFGSSNHYLIKLQIPASARRSSATSRKCRCDKAKTLGIYNLKGVRLRKKSVTNYAYGHDTKYEVGKMVYPDSFDPNRWRECSYGIHFFINKQDAIDYATH